MASASQDNSYRGQRKNRSVYHNGVLTPGCMSGLQGEPAFSYDSRSGGKPWAGARHLYRLQDVRCWVVLVETHELFATVVDGPEPRASVA